MEHLSGSRHFKSNRATGISRGLVILLLLLACALPSRAVTFTASLERDTVYLGESVGLALVFEGAQPQDTPNVPNVANLQIHYTGPASEFSFVNGKTSSKVTHNFVVTPRQPGDYTIPSVTAEVSGQRLATQPLKLKVLKPNAPPPDAASAANQAAFMRLVLPKTNLYLGEVITGTFQLFLREGHNWGQFQFTATPTEGLTIGRVIEGQRQRTQIGNAIYSVVPLNFALSPIKTGPLNIGPITASISATLPPRNSHEAFFGGQRTQISLATDVVEVRCLPVPTENAPASFTGAVGDFAMTVSVGPTNVATGDPITVRVQINGRGALDAVTLPPQTTWADFKTYPPTANIETSDQLGLQGTKTFEQIISPESADLKELPSFVFSFFDPETKTFRTLTHPATKLTVRPGGAVVAPSVAANANPNAASQPAQPVDIVPIKQRLGAFSHDSRPLLMQPLFLATQAVPILAFLAAFVWRKRTDSLANNPRLRRQRQVEQIIRDGLGKLREHATQNQSDEFFAGVMRLLQERLGERLNCPATAITEAVIDDKLRPRGLPDSTLEELHELFQLCNQARYAPIRSAQELNSVLTKLEHALGKLAEVKA
jgi:hypothetical protein